jgi:hypothetical protein
MWILRAGGVQSNFLRALPCPSFGKLYYVHALYVHMQMLMCMRGSVSCICTCVLCACVSVHLYACIVSYMCTIVLCAHASGNLYPCIHNVSVHMYVWYMHIHIHTCMHADMHTTHTIIHMHMYAYICKANEARSLLLFFSKSGTPPAYSWEESFALQLPYQPRRQGIL